MVMMILVKEEEDQLVNRCVPQSVMIGASDNWPRQKKVIF